MKINCHNCNSVFSISPEDKLAGVTEYPCRICGFIVEVEGSNQEIEPPTIPPSAERIPLEKIFWQSLSSEEDELHQEKVFLSVKAHEPDDGQGGPSANVLIPVDSAPWYVMIDENKQGPMDAAALEAAYLSGKIDRDTIVWKEGMSSWVSFESCMAVLGLFMVLKDRRNQPPAIDEEETSSSGELQNTAENDRSVSLFGRGPLKKIRALLRKRQAPAQVAVQEFTADDLDFSLKEGINAFREELKERESASDYPPMPIVNIRPLPPAAEETEPPPAAEETEPPPAHESLEVPAPSDDDVRIELPLLIEKGPDVSESRIAEEMKEDSANSEALEHEAREKNPDDSIPVTIEEPIGSCEIEITVQEEEAGEPPVVSQIFDDSAEIEVVLDELGGPDPANDPSTQLQLASGLDELSAEHEIDQEETKLIRTFALMKEIYQMDEHDAAAKYSIEVARQMVPCEGVRCLLFAPGESELYVAAFLDTGDPSDRAVRLSPDKGVIRFLSPQEGPILISSPESDDRFEPQVDEPHGLKTRNLICVGLYSNGCKLGIIQMFNRFGETEFSQLDEEILAYIAETLGEFIDSSLPERDGFCNKDFAVKKQTG